MQHQNLDVSVLLLQEDGVWLAQCLEYDIVAQGPSIAGAKEAFKQIFSCQIVLDTLNSRTAFEGWEKAPKEFWDMLDSREWTWTREPVYIPNPEVRAAIFEYKLAA